MVEIVFIIFITTLIGIISLLFILKKIKSRTRIETIAFSILLVITGYAVQDLYHIKNVMYITSVFEGFYYTFGSGLIYIGFLFGVISFFSEKY
jgi:DMSO reductase anchor subunit